MKILSLRIYVGWLVLIGLCCSITACSKKPDQLQDTASDTGKPVVYTVNYPLAYFAERIGGDLIDVKFPAPADEDPAYWKPDTDILEGYQQADLILTNGADYAKWMETVSLPTSKCVNTSSVFKDRYIELDQAMTHSHGPTGKHAHGGLAFTTWLDFELAAMQANAIKDALIKIAPDNQSTFETNYAALIKDLFALNQSMKAVAEKIKDIPLVVSHPVYQYWTRGYGLNVISVHWEPDQAPSEQQWTEFKDLLQTHPAKWMIWEGEPISQTVEKLNEMQIQSVIFNPCGSGPSKEDFLSSMQVNIKNLEQIQ